MSENNVNTFVIKVADLRICGYAVMDKSSSAANENSLAVGMCPKVPIGPRGACFGRRSPHRYCVKRVNYDK